MRALATGGIVFAFVFGGAVLGLFLRSTLPDHHLSSESKDVVKLGMGLLATMAALVLSLLIASAKGSYDAQSSEITQLAANVVLRARVWAHSGPEPKHVRDSLRRTVARAIDQMWPQSGPQAAELNPAATKAEGSYEKIQALSPQNEAQRSLRTEALKIAA